MILVASCSFSGCVDLWIFGAGPDTGSKAILLSNQNTFRNSFAMSRLASILVIIVIWTVTYLTSLGASEFPSEEGHRVMPAVQMLESAITSCHTWGQSHTCGNRLW
jgi:hypothetical protein